MIGKIEARTVELVAEERYRIIADEAVETMRQLRPLTLRLQRARSSAERESLRTLIVAAKDYWFVRVAHLLAIPGFRICACGPNGNPLRVADGHNSDCPLFDRY